MSLWWCDHTWSGGPDNARRYVTDLGPAFTATYVCQHCLRVKFEAYVEDKSPEGSFVDTEKTIALKGSVDYD